MKEKMINFKVRVKVFLVLVSLLIVTVISGCVPKAPVPEKLMSFVSAQGTEFIVDGKPFRFIGAFAQNPVTERLYNVLHYQNYKSAIDNYLETLPPNVNVIRIFAYGPYSKSQYGYDKPNWERLDYLAKSAEKHGVYIIWALYDSWDYGATGPPENYQYKFWKDDKAKEIMLAQVSRYKNSPAIFGWELMNEGDYQAPGSDDEREEMLGWVDDVSKAIKAIDSTHLISTGFSNENLRELNFMYPDAYQSRRDFILRTYELPNMDFVTFHAYGGNPDLQTDASFWTEEVRSQLIWYFGEMVKIREEVSKPVIAEEFGTQRQVGEPVRRQVYEFYLGQLLTNHISGCFNTWDDDKTPRSLGVYTYDEEYSAVIDAAQKIKTR